MPSVLLVLLGWTAVSCVVVIPVCLLLRGAAVIEERARRTGKNRPGSPRQVRSARRPVRWCVHTAAGTAVRQVQVGRRAR